MLQYLQERNPFSLGPSLRSISTGVHAHPTVEAVAVEDMILTQMNGTTSAEYAFQKKNQAVTLGLKSSSVKIDGDSIQIDPHALLIFQRLTTVVQSSDNLELAFKHELCSYPFALFDSFLLPHEADKPALADAIWKICESSVPVVNIPDNGIQYVLSTFTTHSMVSWFYIWENLPTEH